MERPQLRKDIPLSERGVTQGSEVTLLNDVQYKDQLRLLIPQAKKRVWIQTMTFDGNGNFPEFQALFGETAERGIDTRFTVDAFYRMHLADSLYYQPHLSRRRREEVRDSKKGKENALAELEERGVQVIETNPPRGVLEKLNPARGRNHRKMAVIDDVVFVGDQHHFVEHSQPGTMTRVTDPLLVDGLADIYESASKGPGGEDYELAGSGYTALLVDAGVPGRSLIMKRAKAAIEGAQRSVVMTNQHTSDGELVMAMQAVQDSGASGKMIVGDPNLLDFPLSWMFDTKSQLQSRRDGITIPTYENPVWIHSNLLLVDEGLPSAQVFMGTRCYSDMITNWGSQEVALQSTNTEFVGQVGAQLRRLEDESRLRKPDRTVREIVFSRGA